MLAFSLFGKEAYAASPIGVYGGIDPTVMMSVIDNIEDDFNQGLSEWTVSKGAAECITELDHAPYSPYEGTHSLKADIGQYQAGQKITLKKSVTNLRETASYRYIAAAIYVPKEAKSATVTMKLVASRGSITSTKTVDGGKWQTVFFETNGVNKGNASRIELSITAEASCNLFVLLDAVGACREEGDIHKAKYLTDSFLPSGCTVEYDRNLTVSLNGEDPYIEANALTSASFGDGIGLRVNMINHTSCRSLTLKYKTAGSYEYDKEITLSLPDFDREITLLYKIPEEKIDAYALYFDGASTGDIEIISVSPSPCFEETASIGKITECRIARDLKNIWIKGKVNLPEELDSDSVMLYALNPNEDNSNIENLREPLSEARIQNGEFSFTVSLDRSYEGIFKKYIVVVTNEEGYKLVCEPCYVNNPEALATERTLHPESKKGIRALPENYIFCGISQTALDIELNELFASSGNGTVSHTVGAVTRHYSKEYLDSLDEKMKQYSSEGISVRFVFKLKSGNTVITHPNSVGENAAFNTETSEGINALRSVTDLLVRRYGSSKGVTDNLVGIVLGNAVNDSYNNYNLGRETLSEFARSYSAALRTVYNASVSITSGFEVSMSLGGEWSFDLIATQKGSYDARSTLEAVSDCISAGGNINWKLAYDITPEEGEYAFRKTSPDIGAGTEKITADNLEALTEFFSLQPFLYNGASRSILLIGNEEKRAANEQEEKLLTTDYIYTFLRISERSMRNISGYIPSHSADYMGALKYIGTDKFSSKTEFAVDLIGKERYELLTGSGIVVDRKYAEATAINELPQGIKGEAVIFNLRKQNVIRPSLNCLTAESGVSYGDRSDWGRIRFTSADGKEPRGFILESNNLFDLTEAPYISFDLVISSLPKGIERINVTVVLYSNKNMAVTETTVAVDKESRIICDMSSFSHLSSCDRIGIYITGENGESIGEPMMLISSVKVHSETQTSDKLKRLINVMSEDDDAVSVYTVINLAIIAFASVTALIVRIIRRNKRPTKTDGNE